MSEMWADLVKAGASIGNNYGDFTADEIFKIEENEKLTLAQWNRIVAIPIGERAAEIWAIFKLVADKKYVIDYGESPVHDIVQVISNTMKSTAETVKDVWQEGLDVFISKGLNQALLFVRAPLEMIIKQWLELLKDVEGIEGDIAKLLTEKLKKENLGIDIALIFILFVITGSIGGVYIQTVLKKQMRHLNKKYLPDIPGFQDFLRSALYDKNVMIKVEGLIEEAGIDKKHLPDYLKAVKQYFNLQEILELHWRDAITPDELNKFLEKGGYTGEERELAKELVKRLPPVQDVIRFAVRDVFNPAVVKDFSLFEEYPEKLTEIGKKWGFDKETLQYYWGSHWQMPSPMMIYDMVHRDVITLKGADDLLRTADWPKKIREFLLKISYRVLSRVDVRRMHAMGVLDRKGVKRAYLNLGYNESDAELMTEFTIRYNTPDEFKLSKSDILSAYRDRILNFATAEGMLKDLGYSENEARFLIAKVDYNENKKLVAKAIKVIKKLYIRGEYSTTKTKSELGLLAVAGEKIDSLITEWNLDIKETIKEPPEGRVKQWYMKGLISETDYMTDLEKRGWSAEHINILVKDAQIPDVKAKTQGA